MRRLSLLLISIGALVLTGCTNNPPPRVVVVWISVDGLRHDYIARDVSRLPTFARLQAHGLHTEALIPVFPSLTFPSHISEATGVTPGVHGIVANTFYDPDVKTMYSFPNASSLILAEPIWVTAERQHIRTAVVDWPLGYQQRGPVKADYFGQAFDSEQTDEQRLDQLLQIWRDDDPAAHRGQPLQLLLGYVLSVDKAGHKKGPDSDGLREQLVETDALLGKFIDGAEKIFREKMTRGDRLYVLITTDHGMTSVGNRVDIDDLFGADLLDWTHIATSGNLTNIHLDDVPERERAARETAILAKARSYPILNAWSRRELPKQFGYEQSRRAGDIVLALKPGYTWSKRKKETTQPSTAPSDVGMHGYWVEDEPNMMGYAVIYSPEEDFGGRNLGRVDSLQLHPTVAKLLGIKPAPGAKAPPIELRNR